MPRKILLLVEGEKTEEDLLKTLFRAFFGESLDFEVVSFGTSVYRLHDLYEENCGEGDKSGDPYRYLDLASVLRAHAKTMIPRNREILKGLSDRSFRIFSWCSTSTPTTRPSAWKKS